jgi:hypothetical protein
MPNRPPASQDVLVIQPRITTTGLVARWTQAKPNLYSKLPASDDGGVHQATRPLKALPHVGLTSR